MKMISSPPKTIPVFPLPGVLLLPRARLPLNIFEKRYLTMIDDALKTDHRLIGMVQPRETPKGKNEPCLQQIGCAGRITSFSETEDGRYSITLSVFNLGIEFAVTVFIGNRGSAMNCNAGNAL